MSDAKPQGPLAGIRVVEFAGLGPAPFACMLLSDLGADVVTICRPETRLNDASNITGRGRRSVAGNIKDSHVRDQVLSLLAHADVLVEGFRPGVMERLGLGPEALAQLNPGLIYGRVTGWGQEGPLAQTAGHDINYIALSGALHAMGPANGAPVVPLNLLGDYAGGSLYLVCGILAALHERQSSGLGQTIDAAITDGTFSLLSTFRAHLLRGQAVERRGSNLLDGGAPFYGVYATADRKHIAIGAIEPQFFALLCEQLGVSQDLREAQYDRHRWPLLHAEFSTLFARESQSQWCELLQGTDCCFAPVLPLSEAMNHPHNIARKAFVDVEGTMHPAPAPRFSRTPATIQSPSPEVFTPLEEVLKHWI
ncbi:MAG TPA: carnitine dehydratase [Pseudomonas sp.]|nr:carnitine dehydratase [Pseudomonas sp.]